MKITKKYLIPLAAILLLFILLLVVFSALQSHSSAVSLVSIPDPQEAVTKFFDYICAEDYASADTLLKNYELVGSAGQPEGEVAQKLHAALIDSLSCTLNGDCEISGNTAVQKVTITYFDLASLSERLNAITAEKMDALVNEMNDSELYDENGSYREEVVMQVLSDAVDSVLEAPQQYYVSKNLSINLSYESSEWLISADDELFECLLGGLQ